MNNEITKYNLVAVGRAYIDIIAHVTPEFHKLHNIPLNGQRECSISEIKKIQNTLSQSQTVAGGSSANTLAFISAMEGKAGFFGKVYNDNSGQFFLKDLEQRNIDLMCPPFSDAPPFTATCLVLLNDDKRSFAFNPGCADNLIATDFDQFNFSMTHSFLIEAHLLTNSVARSAIMHAIANAKKDNICIVMNLQGIIQWDEFIEIAHYVYCNSNVIIGNQDEQQSFFRSIQTLQKSSLFNPLMITTKGSEGAEIFQSNQIICSVPAIKPKIFINTTGAGDAFIAGFLLAQSRGLNINESMQFAVQTAASILEEIGARPII